MLGVDFGERRIGLAVSDEDGRMALPLTVIERTSDRQAITAIRALVLERGIEAIVVGEPLGLDGERGEPAERARRFGRRLGAATGLPLTYVDEALTSHEAERRARLSGSRKRRAHLDALAAQILLQDALDRHERRTPDDEEIR